MKESGGLTRERVEERLRRVMPRVALAAVALFVVRWLVAGTEAYRTTPLGLLGPLTAAAVTAAVTYYLVRFLLRLKRMLLWRVRRRLVITYLFVGLTPVVLLLILGFVATVGGSSQAMVRVVAVQLRAAERQALDEARALAEGLLELPPGAGDAAEREWVEARAGAVRAALPGARVAAWRAEGGSHPLHVGSGTRPRLVSARLEEETRGVGFDTGQAGGPLPSWLDGQTDWGGLAYLPPPEDSASMHGTPFVAGLARRARGTRSVAVLVSIPVSRALVARLREDAGFKVRPYFIGVPTVEVLDGVESEIADAEISVNEQGQTAGRMVVNERGGRRREVDFSRDQLGEPLPNVSLTNFWSPVYLPATQWETGLREERWAFIVDWSWSAGVARLWEDGGMGMQWWRVLYWVGVVFLVLELLALLSAAWMTRAVTGTVHKLYRATEFIKRGDFSHRIRTGSHDQLGELAHAFNDMSADIEQLLTERVERERLEREVEIAAEVQAQLFPRGVPALRTAEMSGECRAARGVAGDYYDFVEVAPGLMVFALGDVSGKGISAALVMSNLQAVLRAQATILSERLRLTGRVAATATAPGGAAPAPESPAEMPCGVAGVDNDCVVEQMAASINVQLCRSTDSNRFATLFLALYDDRTRTLRYTNAGHNPPVVVRAGGAVERLEAGGTVVGAFDFVGYVEGRTTLGAGDLLVLYSDGISEAQNAVGEEFGDERVAEFAAARRHLSPDSLRQALFDEADRWTGDAERYDDQTLVILRGTAEAPAHS